jgi:hypothetical protein
MPVMYTVNVSASVLLLYRVIGNLDVINHDQYRVTDKQPTSHENFHTW